MGNHGVVSLSLSGKHILLIIGGGIAAYKSLELIRRLRERGAGVRAILTSAGSHFVTPLSVSSLTGEKVFQDLFDLWTWVRHRLLPLYGAGMDEPSRPGSGPDGRSRLR